MARKKNPNPTAETLREIEASGDYVVEWASEHAALILGVLASILVPISYTHLTLPTKA